MSLHERATAEAHGATRERVAEHGFKTLRAGITP
jgi:hypothetical protein